MRPSSMTATVSQICALACAARVFELLDADDQIPEAENAAVLQPDGHVQLEDVSFRYLPDRPLILPHPLRVV